MTQAESVIQSIKTVAEKLEKKALDAHARGNANVSKSLLDSVRDLQIAAKFVHTQQKQLSSFEVSLHKNGNLDQLLKQLSGVTLMLDKKSEEMRQKSNENASNALQNASFTVTKASNIIRGDILSISTLEKNMMRMDQLELEMRQYLKAHFYESKSDDTKPSDGISSIQQLWRDATACISVLESKIGPQSREMPNFNQNIDAQAFNGKSIGMHEYQGLLPHGYSHDSLDQYNPWAMQLEDVRSLLVELEEKESRALELYKLKCAKAAQEFCQHIENFENADRTEFPNGLECPNELESLSMVQQMFQKVMEEKDQMKEAISVIKESFHAAFDCLSTKWNDFGWSLSLKRAFAQAIDQDSIEIFAEELNVALNEFEICLKNIDGEHQMLEQELTQSIHRVSLFQKEDIKVRHQNVCLEMAIEDARSHTLRETISIAEDRQSELALQLEQTIKEFEKYRKKSHAALCKMEKRSKVSELETERKGLLETCRKLKETSEMDRERASQLEKTMDRQLLQHEDFEARFSRVLRDVDAENAKLTDEIGDWRRQVDMQKQSEELVRAEWRESEAKWTEKDAIWTKEMEHFSMRNQELETKLLGHSEKCDLLRREIENWIAREINWASDREKLSSKCDQLTDEIAAMTQKIATLENENHSLLQIRTLVPVQAVHSPLISHSEEVEVLKRELESQKSAHIHIQTRYDEAIETIQIKVAVINGLLTEFDRFQMRQEDLRSVCWHLESLLKHSNDRRLESYAASCDSKALQLEISRLEETLERFQFEMLQNDRKLTDEMRQFKVKAEHRSRQLTSFTGEINGRLSQLQMILESYASLFHQCTECQAVRADTHSSVDEIVDAENAQDLDELVPAVLERITDANLYEDALVMRSGVTIKAGATFSLPVVCDLIDSRVLWSFSIDDEADVGFTCVAESSDNETSDQILVEPCRVNSLEGSMTIESPMTLIFEWDNTFSWINAKTMDYQVVIQQLLPPEQQLNQEKIQALQRYHTRLLNEKTIFDEEKAVRECVHAALTHVMDTETEKLDCMEAWKTHWDDTQALILKTQEKLELWKNLLNTYVIEMDEVDKCIQRLKETWNGVLQSKEDAETMLKLSEGTPFAAICNDIARELSYTESVLEKLQEKKLDPMAGLN
uniref:Myosinlike protein putative n=1 Tax=Albugo laibachii Nc14 TaxID=890382 RepID=F0W8D2_9STRA|nr:myosinlike protein putative [Albugo laibachii Nc14]CCA24372.1 myosinlike protein putative [Albugo laibachii Nc14]|eukprot:CCA24372.1 myosinlike protein putative [Albugo laibachii Nc14]